MGALERLEAMLASGRDDALLRYSLGAEHLKSGSSEDAIAHLRRAVEHDAGYSAAWKLLGKALLAGGRPGDAAEAWRAGIDAADARGDRQAAREMQVFLKRIERQQR